MVVGGVVILLVNVSCGTPKELEIVLLTLSAIYVERDTCRGGFRFSIGNEGGGLIGLLTFA